MANASWKVKQSENKQFFELENNQKLINRLITDHIFPETQVCSVRTPVLDELPVILEVQVWSLPVVNLKQHFRCEVKINAPDMQAHAHLSEEFQIWLL